MQAPLEGPSSPGHAVDPLLLPFLGATSEAVAEERLAELLQGTAEPLARRIARSKLRTADDGEAEDVCSEVLVHLVSRLEALRRRPGGSGITDFKSYVAVAAYNACHDLVRARHPQRWRLKGRLRYVLTHQPGLALWEGPGDEALCGFAEWRAGGMRAPSRALDRLREDPRGMLGPVAGLRLSDLVAALLDRLGGPVDLDDLVDAMGRILDIRDAPGAEVAAADAVAAPAWAEDDLSRIDERLSLKRLWDEIAALPTRQRVALLLNLRDPEGRDAIALFPLTGTVSVREIAVALEIPAERFAAMWPDLPLEDSAIAGLLGITRQQVINLRKCARERLGRRLGSARGGFAPGR